MPDAEAFLFGLRNRGSKLGLERMRQFMGALGNPQDSYPVIHIAGSNGKGSTAAMLEAMLREAGYKTGLFTSPHLVYLGERIQVNREPISREKIDAYIERFRALLGDDVESYPTFFEFMTGMAFEYFREEAVDIAIIETGLGGRLDSTNIIKKPIATVITSIALEHTEFLGDTLGAIAAEKAGIMRTGVPVILGKLPAEGEAVVRERAQALGAPLFTIQEAFAGTYPETHLTGDYQRLNAAVATLTCQKIGDMFPVSPLQQAAALSKVQWAGRWDLRMLKGQRLILDGAHNAEGAQGLASNLEALTYASEKALTAVVGVCGESRAEGLLRAVCAHADTLILVKPDQSRGLEPAVLEDFIPEGFAGTVQLSTVAELFSDAKVCIPGDTILVTGSLYLVGEVMQRLELLPDPGLRFQDLL